MPLIPCINCNDEEKNNKNKDNNEEKILNIKNNKHLFVEREEEEQKKENNKDREKENDKEREKENDKEGEKEKLKELTTNSFIPSQTLKGIIEDNDKYSLFYSVIELFEYQTSQKEIAYGLKNSIVEFQRICDDFKINYEKDCFFVEYNEAKKTKLSSFMLWGSKEGLKEFLKTLKQETNFEQFIKSNGNKNKEGIYLSINISKSIAYIIVWPGESKFEQDISNNSILLALIRYGFSIAVNSILCLSENELNNFNYQQYEYFTDEELPMESDTIRFENNKNLKKIFKIKKTDEIGDNLKEKIKGKKIVEGKLNKNCLLLYEEIGDRINSIGKKKDINEFIKDNTTYDIYFDENFNIYDMDPDNFYSLIKNNNCFINILKDKLDSIINDKFKQIIELFNYSYKCKFCNKSLKNTKLFFNKNKDYFHEIVTKMRN